MRIKKSTLLKRRSCAYGNFELVPDDGWRLSNTFVDHESGLLIASVSLRDEGQWERLEGGGRIVPTKEYVIDIPSREILPPAVWKSSFSYVTEEALSEDGRYKLVSTRVHDPVQERDSIKEELIELPSGRLLSRGSGVAFSEKRRETLLEAHYRRLAEVAARRAEIDALPTVEELYSREYRKLEPGDTIFAYHDGAYAYRVRYGGSRIEVLRSTSRYAPQVDASELSYAPERTFASVDELADAYVLDKDWLLSYKPIHRTPAPADNLAVACLVVAAVNDVKGRHVLTYGEHGRLYDWERWTAIRERVKPDAFMQFCANCKRLVSYNPRYPKYVCRVCSSKPIYDEDGMELSFSNVGMFGGFQTTYSKNGEVVRHDKDQPWRACLIDGKKFVATEARFGGIVIEAEREAPEEDAGRSWGWSLR